MIVLLLVGLFGLTQTGGGCLAEPLPRPGRPIPAAYNACIQREIAAEKIRLNEMSAVMESSAPDLRVAFNVLTVAFGTFRDAHAANEVCVPGKECLELQEAARARLTMQMLTVAQRLGKPQTLTATDLQQADATLNQAYERLSAALPLECPTAAPCLTQPTLRDTQRDWIRYRDALSTFATLRWQNDASTWMTLLTRERIAELDAVPAAAAARTGNAAPEPRSP